MSLAYAILAFLAQEPARSGYDLAKQFAGSVGRFWQASHQQIYMELAHLREQGLVEVQVQPRDGQLEKKTYSLTPLGAEKLREWIGRPIEPSPFKDALMVKMYAGHLADPGEVLAEVHRHRARHIEWLSRLRERNRDMLCNTKLEQGQMFRYLTLRRGIRLEEEWVAWCDEVIALLQPP
jgi:DNA-binding PadR family transcriptional regulator